MQSIKGKKHYAKNNKGYVYYRKAFTMPDGKLVRLYAKSKADWEVKKAKRIEEFESGLDQMLNINAKLKDLVTDFLKESENFAPNTFTRREMHMRKNIVPVLGHMKVREIRNAHVKKFYNDVLNNEGINKVREIHFVLNVFFKWAVENEIAIDSNPISEGLIKSLKQKANRKELEDGVGSKDEKINIEEVLGFMKSLRGTREEVIYSLQIHSGLRISEALALTFEDIDMENQTVSINKQVIEMAVNKRKGTRWESIKGMRMITPTKTKNSNRIVPLQPTVARIISETPEEERTGYLFKTRDGFACTRTNWYHRYHLPLMEKLGLKYKTHDLRKFFMSFHASINTPIQNVSKWMGHSKVSTTLDFYAKEIDGLDANIHAISELTEKAHMD